MKVVICGGGIMGTCVAHFLLENEASCVILERNAIACAASGKAGGFLAKDWCGHSSLGTFAKASFELHANLAVSMHGKETYDYRKLEAFSLEINPNASCQSVSQVAQTWINGTGVDIKTKQLIGPFGTIAQLHPYKFVQTLAKSNIERGAEVKEKAEVSGLVFSEDRSKVTGVLLASGQTIEGDAVVITMGPWTGLASNWCSKIPSFYGQKAHSITIKPQQPIPPEALFTNCGEYSPEFYPRPDGEVYVCGLAENPLTSTDLVNSNNVAVTQGSCEKIKRFADLVSTSLKDGEVTCSQACYLPLTHDGLPVIGSVPGVAGLFVAAGHGCWGILNSPATGKALADLIVHGQSQISLEAFAPSRFGT